MMRFFSPRFAPLAEPRPDPGRSMFGLGQATAEYGFRGRAIGHYIRPDADMPRTYLAEPRPDPWRGLRGLGGLDFSTISTIVVVGAVALFGGYMLLLWKDANRPYVLRRNPRRETQADRNYDKVVAKFGAERAQLWTHGWFKLPKGFFKKQRRGKAVLRRNPGKKKRSIGPERVRVIRHTSGMYIGQVVNRAGAVNARAGADELIYGGSTGLYRTATAARRAAQARKKEVIRERRKPYWYSPPDDWMD